MTLTVAYITNRHEPHYEWFADSFHRETRGQYSNIKHVIVDSHADVEDRLPYYKERARGPFVMHPVKPNVWAGKHRLTKVNYFAASNARNTAICLAPDGYIACVDDLSVLMPGWLDQVRQAMAGSWVAVGAYRKVNEMTVKDGVLESFKDHPSGADSRWQNGSLDPQPCGGGWFFGASFAVPVEAMMQINGFDEDCDSMGSEDYITGMMLGFRGWHLKYCRRMMTYESEEHHHVETPFRRIIKPNVNGTKDRTHAILKFMANGRRSSPNYFGAGGIRAVRKSVLSGAPFPIVQIPEHDWSDGQPLREMGPGTDRCP